MSHKTKRNVFSLGPMEEFRAFLRPQIEAIKLSSEEQLPVVALLEEAMRRPWSGLCDCFLDLKHAGKV